MAAKGMEALLLGCVLALVIATSLSNPEFESSIKDVLARRKNLNYIKGLLQDLDIHLEKLQKRSCASGFAPPGGMCEMVDARNEALDQMAWEKGGPGKRSYWSGTEDQKQFWLDHEDQKHWENNSPGKRNDWSDIEDKKHWENSGPGKRMCNGQFLPPGHGCIPGGIEDGKDQDHWENGSPGKRSSFPGCPLGLPGFCNKRNYDVVSHEVANWEMKKGRAATEADRDEVLKYICGQALFSPAGSIVCQIFPKKVGKGDQSTPGQETFSVQAV